jgi:hypothetical protein
VCTTLFWNKLKIERLGSQINQGSLWAWMPKVLKRMAKIDEDHLCLSSNNNWVHLRSLPVFSGVRVSRSLALYVCFVYRCLSLCAFSFAHCVVCFFDIRILITAFGIFKLFLWTLIDHLRFGLMIYGFGFVCMLLV